MGGYPTADGTVFDGTTVPKAVGAFTELGQ
jgi:hypothetical protein